MNTYFEVGNQRFDSREEASKQIAKWKANPATFSVHEVENTEVTRKTAKGEIITENVRGGLDRVPRIISIRKLDPTYIVVNGSSPYGYYRYSNYLIYHSSRVEAEQERAKLQNEVERLAALTDADITEVQMPTLADILERDADKIECLEAEVGKTREHWEQLQKQAKSSIEKRVADLTAEIVALHVVAAKQFGVPVALEKFHAAAKAYHEAIHYDEFEEQVTEKMQEEHAHGGCWPDSDCRVGGECTYLEELGSDEIEEYLLENAEDFEVEEDVKAAAA